MDADPPPEVPRARFPWQRADFHGVKPWSEEYGYYEIVGRGRKRRTLPQACGREELIERCSDLKAAPVNYVWTAESPFIQNIREVPFLHEAFRARRSQTAKAGIKRSLFHLLVWPFLFWRNTTEEDFSPGELEMALFCLTLIFGVIPFIRNLGVLLTARSWTPAKTVASAEATRFQEWLSHDRAPKTFTLCVALLVIGFVQWSLTSSLGASIFDAGLVKQAVREGEYWRLLTGILLHGGPTHLLVNGIALLALGKMVERLAGPHVLGLTLFVAGLTGSLCSQVFLPEIPSVGFSGAILGLLGFLVALGKRKLGVIPRGFNRLLRFDTIFITALGLVLADVIDNGAHIGGLLSGWLLGLLVIPGKVESIPLRPGKVPAALGWVSYRILLVFAGLTLWKIWLNELIPIS